MPDLPTLQGNWRYCRKCYVLFYNGFDHKGACQKGGAHEAEGYYFWAIHDQVTNANFQSEWRFCTNCYAMFYNGYNIKGKCVNAPAHVAQGFNFHLQHNGHNASPTQRDWRYCDVCNALFFDYWNIKGKCSGNPEAFGHVAQGYNFKLLHDWSIEWFED
ncbi:hypothetical protein [Streptomyces sp. NPDC001927]